jgi:hypothetical protein
MKNSNNKTSISQTPHKIQNKSNYIISKRDRIPNIQTHIKLVNGPSLSHPIRSPNLLSIKNIIPVNHITRKIKLKFATQI